MGKINSVLFVCTGNSCRSVMAEALLKKYLKSLGKDNITVRSAGISAMNGYLPTDETLSVLKDEGIDASAFRSKDLTDDIIKNSDLILVMEEFHKERVINLVPEAASRTYLLKEYGIIEKKDSPEGTGVPDPIGKSLEDYRYSMGIIKKEIERIAKLL